MKRAYKRVSGVPITDEQRRELDMLAGKRNRKVDLSDAPPLPDSAWKTAVRGKFYRPVKQAVSFRLDSDVLAWLKKDGDGYQTRANRMLRERMLQDLQAKRKNAA